VVSDARPAIRIFVAMPGTTMGDRAPWSNIPEIKRRLLQPVADRLASHFGRPSVLIVEKDKTSISPIHRSMFVEALKADVYIADLSGANPNVYLELGVRWALRDSVTIPICQDVADVRFNASSTRVIPYGPTPDALESAIDKIVDAAVQGLGNPDVVDNPVRDSMDLVSITRGELAALRDEIDILRGQQAEDLVDLARNTTSLHERIRLLREALSRNPTHGQAHCLLGVSLYRRGDYDEAIGTFEQLVRLKPDDATGWRELGVALSKFGQLDRAATAFRRATDLDAEDAKTWSTLGGLLRRQARSDRPGAFDWTIMREAVEAYRKASAISGNDTYPLINEARIRLLLSTEDPEDRPGALENLANLEHLARYAANRWANDPWKQFDLADTLLLTDRGAEGLDVLRRGIALIQGPERRTSLTSVIEPLYDFLSVPELLNASTATAVRQAINECERAVADESGRVTHAGGVAMFVRPRDATA
jgi:tetratricopeptide (TPR) repeat protein